MFRVLLFVSLGLGAASAHAQGAGDGKRVTAKGMATIEGEDLAKAREQAVRAAQRDAIEQVVGALIESTFSAEQRESIAKGTSDFSATVEDRVYSKSRGFIAKQKVLSEKREGQTLTVILECEVRARSLEEELAQLEGLLKSAGYPKLAVVIAERYTGPSKERVAVKPETAPSIIEAGLLERGVTLLARDAIEARRARGEDLSALADDPARAARVALEGGADVAVVGTFDSTFLSFDEGGDKLAYVAVSVSLRAVDASGALLASVNETGRGVGTTEVTAREAAVKQAGPRALAALLEALVRAWRTRLEREVVVEQLSPGLGLATVLEVVELELGPKKARRARKVERGAEVVLLADGPTILELSFQVLAASAQPSRGVLTCERDRSHVSRWSFTAPAAKGKRPLKHEGRTVSVMLKRHVEVPAGRHRYAVSVRDADMLLEIAEAKGASRALLMPAEEPLPKPAAPPPPPAAELPLVPPPTNEAPRPAVAAPAPSKPAGPAAPLEIEAKPKDGTVTAAAAALAEAFAQAYAQLGRPEPFHRVAVPAFEQAGDLGGERMGELVSELLAVELGNRKPWVVVERQRMSQLMKEHRLKDLGVVDPSYAAEFGRVLGAQSILMGTVGEAGPSVIVTVRQVDAETGAALSSAKVQFERASLVALSSELVELKSRSNALFRSLLIPGWGQLYNEEPVKGAAFLGAGVGLLGAATFYLGTGMAAKSRYENNTLETVGEREVANDKFRIGNTLLITYGLVWAMNAIDAYVNGQDSERVKVPATAEVAQ